jgi:hypothetical protein
MKRVYLIASLSLALAACQTTQPISTAPIQVVSDQVVLQGTRGLILAHNAYQGAAAIVAPLVRSKQLSPATVDRIEVLNEKARVLFTGADKAQSLADRTAGLLEIANELLKIGGK